MEKRKHEKVCAALFGRRFPLARTLLGERKVTRVGGREKQVLIDVTYRCRFDRFLFFFFHAAVYPPSTRFFHLTIIKRILPPSFALVLLSIDEMLQACILNSLSLSLSLSVSCILLDTLFFFYIPSLSLFLVFFVFSFILFFILLLFR